MGLGDPTLLRVVKERAAMAALNCSYTELRSIPTQVVRDHLTYLTYQKDIQS